MPLNPTIWAKEMFSSMSMKTCSICGFFSPRPERNERSHLHIFMRAHRAVSQATQTVSRLQPRTVKVHLTTHAKALHTHLATQYQALQTHFATQYQARQKKPAMQFQGVYKWNSSHDVHWLDSSSAHSEHWFEPSSAHVVHS